MLNMSSHDQWFSSRIMPYWPSCNGAARQPHRFTKYTPRGAARTISLCDRENISATRLLARTMRFVA
jgi:hypothetical protein